MATTSTPVVSTPRKVLIAIAGVCAVCLIVGVVVSGDPRAPGTSLSPYSAAARQRFPSTTTQMDDSKHWTKCIGNAIAKCFSCVAQAVGDGLETILDLADGEDEASAGFETVKDILEFTHQAMECAEICGEASTDKVAKECGSFYCQTNFCVACCGPKANAVNTQCQGNSWQTQCAPRPPYTFDYYTGTDLTPGCQCMPDNRGGGDPDSCCAKCNAESNPKQTPNCRGNGKNTGNFCGNDFHITEHACGGDTPLCCVNNFGQPKCCRADQNCPGNGGAATGNAECVDASSLPCCRGRKLLSSGAGKCNEGC